MALASSSISIGLAGPRIGFFKGLIGRELTGALTTSCGKLTKLAPCLDDSAAR